MPRVSVVSFIKFEFFSFLFLICELIYSLHQLYFTFGSFFFVTKKFGEIFCCCGKQLFKDLSSIYQTYYDHNECIFYGKMFYIFTRKENEHHKYVQQRCIRVLLCHSIPYAHTFYFCTPTYKFISLSNEPRQLLLLHSEKEEAFYFNTNIKNIYSSTFSNFSALFYYWIKSLQLYSLLLCVYMYILLYEKNPLSSHCWQKPVNQGANRSELL